MSSTVHSEKSKLGLLFVLFLFTGLANFLLFDLDASEVVQKHTSPVSRMAFDAGN